MHRIDFGGGMVIKVVEKTYKEDPNLNMQLFELLKQDNIKSDSTDGVEIGKRFCIEYIHNRLSIGRPTYYQVFASWAIKEGENYVKATCAQTSSNKWDFIEDHKSKAIRVLQTGHDRGSESKVIWSHSKYTEIDEVLEKIKIVSGDDGIMYYYF